MSRLRVFSLTLVFVELFVRSVNMRIQVFVDHIHGIEPCLVAEEPDVLVPLKPQSETSENVHHGPAYGGSLWIYKRLDRLPKERLRGHVKEL